MRPSRRDRGLAGRWTRIRGWAVALALTASSARAVAEEPRERSSAELDARELSRRGDHAGAAEKWADVAATATDSTTRMLAAFQGYQEWSAAYAEDHDVRRLCAARTLLMGLCERGDLGDDVRDEADRRIADLDARIIDHPGAATCEDAANQGSDRSSGDLLPVRRSATQAELLPVRLSSPTSPGDPRVDDRTRPARGLTIGGGVMLGLGASLLGATVYGVVIDARSGAALLEYKAKKDAGTLMAADWTQIYAIEDQGLRGARLAKITGIVGGAAVITGAALLIHARRVRKRSIALYPDIGRGQAGLGLRGRF